LCPKLPGVWKVCFVVSAWDIRNGGKSPNKH
jgi:hypothetical protein